MSFAEHHQQAPKTVGCAVLTVSDTRTTETDTSGQAIRDLLKAADQDVHCTSTNVTVNAAAFNAPIGNTTQVNVTVTCTVDLSDLSIPGVPGTRTITATARSPVDAYRER